jgi:type IV pilus assembly protein PilW
MNSPNLKTSRRMGGFTMVELMVAITIALFLLGGVFASVQSTRQAYKNQNLLAQLQDNERLAMTLITTAVQSAGYFPNPVNNSATSAFPIDALFGTAGQVIAGAVNAAGPGDALSTRYQAALDSGTPDNVYNCIGRQNLTAGDVVYESTFFVDNNNNLVCQFNGTNYQLVTASVVAGATTLGLKSMTILYGVKMNGADTGSCTDTYMTAAQVQAVAAGPAWAQVCSVYVTLTFINPMQPADPNGISISRVIAVMGTAGVNS